MSGRAFALRIAVAIGVLAVVATRPTPPSFDAVLGKAPVLRRHHRGAQLG